MVTSPGRHIRLVREPAAGGPDNDPGTCRAVSRRVAARRQSVCSDGAKDTHACVVELTHLNLGERVEHQTTYLGDMPTGGVDDLLPARVGQNGQSGAAVGEGQGGGRPSLAGSNIMAGQVREVVAHLAAQAADGTLKIHASTQLPLEQAAEGLATIADGRAHGKIVVTIAD